MGGSGGPPPGNFENLSLKWCILGALPYHSERVGGGSGGPHPGNFENLTLKWRIFGALPYHSDRSRDLLLGANICSDLLQAHFRTKCLGANSEFYGARNLLQRYRWTTLFLVRLRTGGHMGANNFLMLLLFFLLWGGVKCFYQYKVLKYPFHYHVLYYDSYI